MPGDSRVVIGVKAAVVDVVTDWIVHIADETSVHCDPDRRRQVALGRTECHVHAIQVAPLSHHVSVPDEHSVDSADPRPGGTDRARTPSPYSPAETAWIRDRLVRSRTRPACPKCGGTLTVGLGAVRFGIAVREVSCARCRRTLMVRERAGARVVVVDRELGARGALCNVLTQAGYDAEQAEDGDAALRLSQTNRPDVLIVSMANLGSAPLELIRRLRRELPGVGGVAMAGPRRYGAPDVLAQARSMAAIEILRAPFKPEELLRAVEAATSRPT